MNTLKIKNFGPIKDVSLNIKKVNLLIGTQGGGKSTIAKLLSIMNDPALVYADSLDRFIEDYNINFGLSDNTFIEYATPSDTITIKGKSIEHSLKKMISDSTVNKFEELFWDRSEKQNDAFYSTMVTLSMGSSCGEEMRDFIFSQEVQSKNCDPDLHKIHRLKLIRMFLSSMRGEQSLYKCIYIPAERNLIALIAENYFALGDSLGLPKCIWRFGANYERARKSYESKEYVDIPFIDDLKFRRVNKKDEIVYHGVTNPLTQGSSGFQSSVPLAVVCTQNRDSQRSLFVIEEPEQNLYPDTQYHLVKFLADNCLKKDNMMLITTHSPYIISSFVNLIQASSSGLVRPRKTANIIPRTQWIDFDDVSAYFIDQGTTRDILDYNENTIIAESIDSASTKIAEEFDNLLEIAYKTK